MMPWIYAKVHLITFFVEQTIWPGEGKHDSAINRGQKMGYPS